MALQIWMPMVSDFNNQGLQNSTITNNSVTLDNNGKLGKCGKFTGSNYISGTINLGDSIEYTLACWVKPPDVSAGNKQIVAIAPNSGWANCRATMFYRQNTAEFIATLSNGTDSLGYTMGMTATPNVWQHIAVTFKNKTMIWYSNGVVQKTLTTTIDPKFSDITAFGIGSASNGAEKFTGYINDVRIYDHALSAKEVEVLSRGLVCHYPLNGGGRGGDNLLKNTGDLTLWTKESGITTTWDSEKNMYKIEDSTHTNSRWGIYQDINVEANTSYTITVTLDGTACGAGFAVYDSSTSFPPAVIGTTGRQSYTLTSGANSTKARIYLYTNCGVNNVAWFSLPKVEKSDHTTPWIPNSEDTAYSTMGYDSTTEYDVSGYGNNGTKNGTISYTSDSARYSVASHFNGSSYISRTSPSESVRSASFWIKTPKTNYTVAWGDYKSKLAFGIVSSGEILTCCGMTSAVIKKYPNSVIAANTWQHIVLVRNDAMTNMDLYVNGVKQTATGAADYWTHQQDTLIISGRDYSTPSRMICDISDFRLYATTLTETQIKDLYNTAVSVANSGALLGYELVES